MDFLLGLAEPWAYLIIGLIAAAEASAFLGLVLPGEATMILGGVLASRGRVELATMVASACIGAIVGDSIGYEIGRHLGPRLQHGWLGRRVGRERWDRANRYVRDRGGRAVFFGRFVGVLRALVPAIAGQAGIPYGTFLLYNVAGGVLWASGFVLIGAAAGGSWRVVERWAGRASLVVLLVVAIAAAIFYVANRLGGRREEVVAWIERLVEHPLVRPLRERLRPLFDFTQRRLDPNQRFGLYVSIGALIAIATGWIFGAILEDVLGREEVARVDRPVIRFLLAHRERELNEVMRVVTFFGSTAFVAVALGVAAVWVYVRSRSRRLAAFAAGVLVGALGLSNVIKPLVERPRPNLRPLVEAGGHAFPSGHATAAAACFAALAFLIARNRSWRTALLIWAGAALGAFLVALSRVYLGVHWPTDVLAGMALGTFWTATVGAATAAMSAGPSRRSTRAEPDRAFRAGG